MKRILIPALLLGALVLGGACSEDEEEPEATTEATATADATQAPTDAATQEPEAAAGLDASFGEGGVQAVPLSATENDRFLAAALDGDGNLFASGWVMASGDSQFALAKFTPEGTPDSSFGEGGIATVNVASGGKGAEQARALVILPDGKVLVGGPVEHDTSATGDAARDNDFAVVRFNADGTLDTSFGSEGIAQIDVAPGRAVSDTAFATDQSWGLGTLGNGTIVAFGSALSQGGADRTDTDFFLAGLTAEGALDEAFGTGGFHIFDSEGGDNPRHITMLSDGGLVATGYSNIDGIVHPVLIKLTPDGALDESFGEGGKSVTQVLPGVAESYAVGVQGDSYISAGYGRGADENEKVDMVVERYDATGAWDKTFGTDGLVRLDLAKEDDRARNVTVLPDNRILAVGSGKMDATNVDALVYLMDENGGAVADFGEGGHVLSDLGGTNDAWYGVAVTADGEYAWVVGFKGVAADSGQQEDAFVGRIKL